MKSCYCYETDKYYPGIKIFFQEENIPLSKYGRVTSTLRHSQVAEVGGYHIGYSREVVLQELEEWRQPSPLLDVEVNAKGELRKKSTKLPKTPQYDQFGYQYIMLKGEDSSYKSYRVHRLIAQAFLDNYAEELVVDHINGIRDDNRVENLAMKTQQENIAARDANNQPLYQELRRLVKQHGYERTLEILKQF